MAQGFSQIGGINYDDTYAPVATMASSRAIIAMANKLGMVLHQLNIKGAYLNGMLNDNKVLYMVHPLGYKPSDVANCVLRLLKVSPPGPGTNWADWSNAMGREMYLRRALEKLNLEYPPTSDG